VGNLYEHNYSVIEMVCSLSSFKILQQT